MTLTLNLPPALEESLRLHAAASGMDVEAFVIEAVRSKVVTPVQEPVQPRIPTEEELDALFDEIAAMHPPVGGHVDDSRESIYD
jgi:hypothetical protein